MSAVLEFKQQPITSSIMPFVCIDIETCNASPEAIELELSLWKAPGNWKPETVEAKRVERAETIREKSALLDSAPIATIGICNESGESVVFHWLLLDSGEREIGDSGYFSNRSVDEKEMLIEFRKWAERFTDDTTVIVGFNLGFDLPHLRVAFTRHGLRIPRLLTPRAGNPIADVMQIYTKYFTSKSDLFISLGEVSKRLGIDQDGKQVDGAMVPVMVDNGFADNDPAPHEEIIVYNAIDTLLTMRAFLIMTGQAGE